MPFIEKFPASTSVVTAGWTNPTNAYTFNNSLTYTETNTACQQYDGYSIPLTGNEVIDKVLVRLKTKTSLTTVAVGDTAVSYCNIQVYDGSTWTEYQIMAHDYTCTTANDESFSISEGDNTNADILIDVTSIIDTLAKLQAFKTRLYFAVNPAAGVTIRWSIDCISVIVCYHVVGGVMATPPRNSAITKQSMNPRVKKALLNVKNALSH